MLNHLKIRTICLSVFLVFVSACSTGATSSSKPDSRLKLTGYYVFGLEVSSFEPCDKQGAYWVLMADVLEKSVEERYYALTSKPYEKVFVAVFGAYSGKATDGFAMDYEGQVRFDDVMVMREPSSSDCDGIKS